MCDQEHVEPLFPCSTETTTSLSPTSLSSSRARLGVTGCRGTTSVRVGRQVVVTVASDTVVFFTRLPQWVHVDHGRVEVAQLVKEAVVDLPGNTMSLDHREGGVHSDINLGTQAMLESACPHLPHLLHVLDVTYGVSNLFQHPGIYSVQEASKHHLTGLLDDDEDGEGDEQAHDRVGER